MNLAKTVFLLFICTTSLLFVKSGHPPEHPDEFSDTETFLTNEDFENAKKHPIVEKGKIDHSAMYNSDLFEGDISNPELNVKGNDGAVLAADTIMRNAVKPRKFWPNGRIPYTMVGRFNAFSRQVVASAVAEIHAKTCIRFVPRQEADVNYVRIKAIAENICESFVGNRKQGAQDLKLGPGCMDKGKVIHEMMHAIGFWHEQARRDRDKYITVHYRNILRGQKSAFKKRRWFEITDLGTPYDYGSIMHYEKDAFGINGKNTITPKQAGVFIGHQTRLSPVDALEVNMLYKCTTITTTCRDTNRFCRYYRRFCTRSGWVGKWVGRVCKKTCDLCGCQDNYPASVCNYYAGWCKTNAVVRLQCRKSCRLCRK